MKQEYIIGYINMEDFMNSMINIKTFFKNHIFSGKIFLKTLLFSGVFVLK